MLIMLKEASFDKDINTSKAVTEAKNSDVVDNLSG